MASKSANLTIRILGDYSSNAIARAEKDLRDMNVAAAKVSGGFTQSMAEMGQSVMDAGSRMEYAGTKLENMGVKVTKATAPILAAGAASVKMASDYEDSVAKVYTIMDKSAVSTDKMSKDILDLSTATGKSANELAEATYQALSASVATEKAVPFVEQSVKLAKVGFTETTAAVDVLTTAINAYGMSADDAEMISNRLVQTQNKGKTTVNELAQNIGNVIPTAAAYNVSLDNLCSSYVTLTKQGINTANATTAINGMLTELADEGSTVAGILRDKTGKSFGQLMQDGMSLGEVIGILSDSVNGNSEEFANLWGNVRASKGALAIANAGVDAFNKTMGDMADSTGLVDSALEDLQTPAAKANKAINALKNTGIELGQEILKGAVPSLEGLAGKAQGLYTWFSSLNDGTKQAIVTFGGLTVAAGPAMTIIGKGMQVIGGFTQSIGSGIQAVASFGARVKEAHAGLVAANGGVATASTRMTALAETVTGSAKAMNILKGAVTAIGLAAIAVVVGEIVAKFQAWREQQATLVSATEDLSSIMREAEAGYGSYSGAVSNMNAITEDQVQGVRNAIQAQADLNQQVKNQYHDMGVAAAEVDYYAGVITTLGDKGSLTAEEQFKLTHAVEQFNEKTGSSISVINAQTGELSANKDSILAVADAWKEEAKTEALKSTYTKYLEQLADNTIELEEAQRQLNEADEGWGIWFGNFGLLADDANYNYHLMQDGVNDLTTAHGDLENKIAVLEGMMGKATENTFPSFDDALASCGVSVSDLGNVSESTLGTMRNEFDGSLSSIVLSCSKHGVEIPAALASAIESNKGSATDSAYGIGTATTSGLARGIEDGSSAPKEKTYNLLGSIVDAAKSFLGIHSPSTVMMDIGENIDEGLARGISGNAQSATGAMDYVGSAVRSQIGSLPSWSGDIGRSTAYSFGSGISSANTYGTAQNVAINARNGLSSIDTYNAGWNFSVGFENGMSGPDIWSAAWNVGVSALDAIKRALGIRSPSKEAMKVGEYFGEGAIIGMRSTESGIAAEAQRMSSQMALTPSMPGSAAIVGTAGGYQTSLPLASQIPLMAVTVNVYMNDAEQAAKAGRTISETLQVEWDRYRRSNLG